MEKENQSRKYRDGNRVYQYQTGRGGVALGSHPYRYDENRVYQYATGRGGVPLSRQDIGEEQGKHYGKGPKGWSRSDEQIREEVCDALYRSGEVDASGIEVDVKDGCVYLSGTVESRDMKKMAEAEVENISGVKDVQNKISLEARASH